MRQAFGLMQGRAVAIAAALLLALAIAGCGESRQKRAVDARTEVLRFYAVDTPVVALVRTDELSRVVALNQAATGIPAWASLRNLVLGPLQIAGMDQRQLGKLLRPSTEVEGLDATAIGLGAPTPDDLASRMPLLVLATDQSELLAQTLAGAARSGGLRRAGRLDDAALYEGRGAAFAVRDGVLVSAPNLAEVRAAVERRDGSTDQQLDEDVVESLFNDLDPQGPLLVYADLNQVRKADPGMRTLARLAPWTGDLGPTAATARAVGDKVRIEDFSKSTGAELSSADLPIGATASPFEITDAGAASLLPQPGPVRNLLGGLAPLSGDATASSDEVRLQVTAGG
jgi:hypothetical protein